MNIGDAVTTVESSEEGRALGTLTSAFIADPLFRWAYPDPEQYLASFPRAVMAYCGSGIAAGTAHQVADFGGAAIWVGPGEEADGAAAGALLQETVPPERQEDFFGVLGQMDDYHPHDEELWYLPFIGVDASRQGEGLGSLLMKHALQLCDEAGLRAYLESSNPRNIPFYERHGFEVMGRIEVGSAPPMHPMIRERR